MLSSSLLAMTMFRFVLLIIPSVRGESSNVYFFASGMESMLWGLGSLRLKPSMKYS